MIATTFMRLVQSRTRCLPLAVIAAGVTGLLATPALAAPEWGVTMTHANAYGAQGGVDPFTGSGSTFDRESGFNAYTITVKNTGDEATGSVTNTLTCEHGKWFTEGGTSFSYQWLRNGIVIAGATGEEYTLTPADEGKAVQCVVTGRNQYGATSFAASALLVSPEPSTKPPANDHERPVAISEEDSFVPVGEELTCFGEEEWEGEPTSFSYQWLRNGAAISGATSEGYTVTAADEGAAVQCQVTAANAGGSAVAIDPEPAFVEPENEEGVAPVNFGGVPSISGSGNETGNASMSVSDQLPTGLVLAGREGEGVSSGAGTGWDCTIDNPGAVTCTRSDSLAAGASYPPITLHVHVKPEAPLGSPPSGGVTNVATVFGGDASPSSASASDPTAIAEVPFGIQSFTTSVNEALGDPFTQAGGHPFEASAMFVFNYEPDDEGILKTAGGSPKDIETELPPGFVGSPQEAPKCPVQTFEAEPVPPATQETPCPIETAVGYIHFSYSQGTIEGGQPQPFTSTSATDALYNLVTSKYPAAFGFIGSTSDAHFTLTAKVRSDGDYGITIGSPYTATPTLLAAKVTFCGNGVTQSGSSTKEHVEAFTYACTPVTAASKPFLTNPTQCSSLAPVTTLRANSYEDPGAYASMSAYTGAPSASPAFAGGAISQDSPVASSFLTGCDLLQFDPKFEFKPETTQAGQPTGMEVDLRVPQTDEPDVNATPELKDATVTLPEGMSVSPSAVDGLQACSDAQFGLGSSAEPAEPATCPLASQLGTVRIVSPLLENPLAGQVFLGQPECSPCSDQDAQEGHIFRLFLQAQGSGVIVKVAGKVSADPVTGRLTASFEDQPQLPFSLLELKLKGGSTAPLVNPQRCGATSVGWDMTPWSAPGVGGLSGQEAIAGTPDAIAQEPSFGVDWDGHGGGCPASLPFNPSFTAGTASQVAGGYSDFSLTFGRPEPSHESEERDEQNLAGITVVAPPGLLGRIAGVPLCEEPQASAGTCSQGSQIGTTTVGAGAGSHPYYVSGKVYLTGPYKGAPVWPVDSGACGSGTVQPGDGRGARHDPGQP